MAHSRLCVSVAQEELLVCGAVHGFGRGVRGALGPSGLYILRYKGLKASSAEDANSQLVLCLRDVLVTYAPCHRLQVNHPE